MLTMIGEMFIDAGLITDKSVTAINNNTNDLITGKYHNGKMYITHSVLQDGGMRDYRSIPVKEYITEPFSLIQMDYKGSQIILPALLLVNSWSNSLATPEGIFYNYDNENVTLTEKNKDALFNEFVEHYLPSGFMNAFGNPLQMIIMACIAIVTGGLIAELEVALAAAGLAMSAIDGGKAIYGIMEANNAKIQAQTIHSLKKAAKLMADNIAKLTVASVDIICTVAGFKKGNKKIENKQTTERLLNQSKCSQESLLKYLESIDQTNAKYGKTTNYADVYRIKGKWPDEVQIPSETNFLTSNGKIDWDRLAQNGGSDGKIFIGEDYAPKKGSIIDRYGSSKGNYVSPVIDEKPYLYTERSLPFIEDGRQYHMYEVQYDSIFECINVMKNDATKNALLDEYKQLAFSSKKAIFSKSKIAPAFNQKGGGIQYEFGFSIEVLLKIGYLKEL